MKTRHLRCRVGCGNRAAQVQNPPRGAAAAAGDPNHLPAAAPPRKGSGGFTLLEILLAISIAVGLLMVVLYFYQQSANFRDQLLVETERVSSARLIMDRLTAELRSVPGRCYYTPALSGSATMLQFIRTEVPSRAAWVSGQRGRSAGPETDLRLVKYSLGGDTTNASGLMRTEEPMVTKLSGKPAEGATATTGPSPASPPPLTKVLQYLNFRYYDGTAWQDSWNSEQLPRGIEVSLAANPPSTNSDTSQFPADLYRRVIFIPSNGSNRSKATNSESADTPAEPPPAEPTPSP